MYQKSDVRERHTVANAHSKHQTGIAIAYLVEPLARWGNVDTAWPRAMPVRLLAGRS